MTTPEQQVSADAEAELVYEMLSDLSEVPRYDVDLRDHPTAWAAVEKFLTARAALAADERRA